MSASYPIYSMYVTVYTAVTTVSLLTNTQYVCYDIPQYQLSASYPMYSMYVTLHNAEPTVSLLPSIQYVYYVIYHRTKCQPLTQCRVCMLRYIPQ